MIWQLIAKSRLKRSFRQDKFTNRFSIGMFRSRSSSADGIESRARWPAGLRRLDCAAEARTESDFAPGTVRCCFWQECLKNTVAFVDH